MTDVLFIFTGPSCSGKSHMMKELEDAGIVKRLVTATTRARRDKETDGKDYYFVEKQDFGDMYSQGKMIETNMFGNHMYGLTKQEVAMKRLQPLPMAVILDPNGLRSMEYYARRNNVRLVKVFFTANLRILIQRFLAREGEINTKRLVNLISTEVSWQDRNTWDFVFDETMGFEDLAWFISRSIEPSQLAS